MYKIRVRVIIGAMIFLGYFLIYLIRYNISVHIVDMVQITKREEDQSNTSVRTRDMLDIVNWDDLKVAKLFSAYHIGYCICFPIFHNLGDSLGPTWIVGIAGMTSGVVSCLAPVSAYYNFWALFLVRIIEGFCAGAMQPSMVQVLRHWVPPVERHHFIWAYCGITTGTFSTFLICAAIHYYSHWPIGYYISGSLQMAWSTLWLFVVTDYPQKHHYISKEESDYLTNTIGTIFTIKVTNTHAPWKSILRSVPVWALCTLNFGYAWMIISLCIYGPFFYSRVLKYSLYNASALTALPFLLRLFIGTIVIQSYHWYKQHTNIKDIQHLRKYFIVLCGVKSFGGVTALAAGAALLAYGNAHVIPGFLLSVAWLLPVEPGPMLLTATVALTAAGMDLTLDLCYELTPTYVNSIHTVIKIIGNLSGIIVSICVGQVTNKYKKKMRESIGVIWFPLQNEGVDLESIWIIFPCNIQTMFFVDKNTIHTWKHIWCFNAFVLLTSGFVFLTWGDTHVQAWNTQQRIRRIHHRALPKPSLMSNITEVDENESPIPLSTPNKMKSLIMDRFRISQTKV